MKKLIYTAVTFGLLLTVVCFFAFIHSGRVDSSSGTYAVQLNEIQKLCEQGDNAEAARLSEQLRLEIAAARTDKGHETMIPVIWAVCIVFLMAAAVYLWQTILKPFHKLTDFAERLATGDMEIPLEYERTNYFGKFTWAFDSMRREIIRARECEREAIENNKTVIASLSHDIKTPVASIRAYAEALEMGMDGNAEKRQKYISTILSKCDEVSELTEDMFVHSLSDLDKLTMRPEPMELVGFMEKSLAELDAGRGDINFDKPLYSLQIKADSKRLEQLIGNLINNSRKYAKTQIDVSIKRLADRAEITVSDHGGGIPDEDLPFVFNKFYRGKNCGDENGAGLGLYIVRYIAVQSGGEVKLKNTGDGLAVTVSLPIDDE